MTLVLRHLTPLADGLTCNSEAAVIHKHEHNSIVRRSLHDLAYLRSLAVISQNL